MLSVFQHVSRQILSAAEAFNFIFTLPHEIVIFSLLWTWMIISHEIGEGSKSNCFLTLRIFWVYAGLTMTVNCLVSFYILNHFGQLLPQNIPNLLTAATVGLLGTAFGNSLFQISYKPIEGLEIGSEQTISKLKNMIIDKAIEKKGLADNRNADEFASMIATATIHQFELEEEYMRIVGNTLADPDGEQAEAAKQRMLKYQKTPGRSYLYHLSLSMVRADQRASLRFLRYLYWKRGGIYNRCYRWFGKGVVKVYILTQLA